MLTTLYHGIMFLPTHLLGIWLRLHKLNTAGTIDFLWKLDPSKLLIPSDSVKVLLHHYNTHTSDSIISTGHTLIAIEKSQSPESKLYCRFWLHEHKWSLQLSDSIIKSLATLGETYEVELVEGCNDLTDCFKNNFKEPRHKYILDFATHTRMDRYPPAVTQTCIDYLSSVAIGKPKQHKVPRTTAIIMSRNPVTVTQHAWLWLGNILLTNELHSYVCTCDLTECGCMQIHFFFFFCIFYERILATLK